MISIKQSYRIGLELLLIVIATSVIDVVGSLIADITKDIPMGRGIPIITMIYMYLGLMFTLFRSIIQLAHLDIDADLSDWDKDPFELTSSNMAHMTYACVAVVSLWPWYAKRVATQ